MRQRGEEIAQKESSGGGGGTLTRSWNGIVTQIRRGGKGGRRGRRRTAITLRERGPCPSSGEIVDGNIKEEIAAMA